MYPPFDIKGYTDEKETKKSVHGFAQRQMKSTQVIRYCLSI